MVNMQDALLKSMIYEVAILLACLDEFELGRHQYASYICGGVN